MYAGVAFIITELVNNISEPLYLPDWIATFVILLLIIGFPIIAILSWIFDVTPEGLKKTEPVDVATEKGDEIKSTRRKLRASDVIITILVVVVCILLYPKIFNKKKVIEFEKSIAVLPFDNLSSDEEQAWFSDGITDVIINQLSRISDFRVLGRTSTLKYRGEKKTVSEIGEELEVNFLIEGTVQRQEDQIRISVQLIQVPNEGHIWSDLYDRDWKDIFDIQSDIAYRIAKELKTILTSEQQERLEKRHTNNPEAYNSYLQGRFFWAKRTEDGLEKSVEYFEKALAFDPYYALAYAGLADAYQIQAWWGWIPWIEGNAKAKEFALRALDIDKNLAEAYSTLGAIALYQERNWEIAEKEFKYAVELNPNYATAYQYYAEYLLIIGKTDEALAQINYALKLDPLSIIMNNICGHIHAHAQNFNEAIRYYRKAQEIDKHFQFSYTRIFMIYVQQGMLKEAVSEIQKMISIDTSTIKYVKDIGDIFDNSGLEGVIRFIIELEPFTDNTRPYYMAALHSILGENDSAMEWLEYGYRTFTPLVLFIKNDPHFNNLSTDPRYIALLKKMSLN
jgi:TolB-like protein